MIPVTVNSGPLKDTVSIALCFHTPLKSYFISTCAQVRQKNPYQSQSFWYMCTKKGKLSYSNFTDLLKWISKWAHGYQYHQAVHDSAGMHFPVFHLRNILGFFVFVFVWFFCQDLLPTFRGFFFFFFRKSHFHEELLFILVLNTRMGFYLK